MLHPPRRILKHICKGPSPCQIVHRFDAGHDEQGNTLEVFLLGPSFNLGSTDEPLCANGHCWTLEDAELESSQFDYWLVVSNGSRIIRANLMAEDCGARCNYRVRIGNNCFEYWRQYASAGIGTVETQIGMLSPLTISRESFHHWYGHTGDGYPAEKTLFQDLGWDFLHFLGTTREWQTIELFSEDGQGEHANIGEKTLFSTEANLIPMIDLPKSFTAAGWRTTALGGCAATANRSIHGAALPSRDGTIIHALRTGNLLFIEVEDPSQFGPSNVWLHDDHLELWLGESTTEFGEPATKTELRQWAIRLMDGKVFSAYGHPEPLRVEHEWINQSPLSPRHRFKIHLPKNSEAVTVVYSDTDDGKSQTRLLATSSLRYGDPHSLGAWFRINSDRATCRVMGDHLEPVIASQKINKDSILFGQ